MSSPRGRPCGPAVYWFWDRVPDRAQARAHVRAIADAGFAMVMIQARLSMDRASYLSPAYLRGYRHAVAEAGAAGLEVGIYDEYNWISGHGGGRTVTGADELRERHLLWTSDGSISEIASAWIDGLGPAGARWIYEDGRRRWDDWELVAAVAHAPDGAQRRDVSAFARVRGGPDGCMVALADDAPVPAGWAVTSFVTARCASSRLVNHLDPRVAERFIDVVYRPYLEALTGLIGDPVTCLSFDHPYGGFYDWRERTGDLGCSLPWDPELLPGDPTQLLALVRDVGESTVAARCRFFSAYGARMRDSFLRPLRSFADAHGLGLTGHELLAHVGGFDLYGPLSEGLDVRASFAGDAFAVDEARTETLVDASNFEAQVSPIMGDSVARAHGRGRCVVEQYAARREPPEDFAAGYWELSLPELRLQALRLHLLGARRFLFHAWGSSDGCAEDETPLSNPRLDFPPAINFEPWSSHLRAFCAESEAVSAFIEDGEPVREVALVHPLHTLWARGQEDVHGARFGGWARLLARAGVGFDVVDDRALDRADVADGRVWLGGHGYRAVVLAGISVVVSPRTVQVLGELARAGGLVMASAPAPAVAADGRTVDWPWPAYDGVPASVPDALCALGGPVAVEVDDEAGPGTLWRWIGHDRVVLLNDAQRRRTVRVDGRHVELEPQEVACLTRPVARDRRLAVVQPLATLGDGWTFAAGDRAAPVAIDPARGWEQQGFERFSGVGVYRRTVTVPAEATALELPVVDCAASVSLNGVSLGARGWPPYRFALAGRREGGELVIRVASSAANRYYAGTRFARAPQPSGLGAAPRFVREAAGA